jgi:hypothetical protein
VARALPGDFGLDEDEFVMRLRRSPDLRVSCGVLARIYDERRVIRARRLKEARATIPVLYAMLFLALSPCGAALSIDRLFAVGWARARGRVPRDSSTSVYARWPLELVYAELAAFYFLADWRR